MSSVWFYAKIVPPPKDTPFTEAADKAPENVLGWFELHRNGEYWGWCHIQADGQIEFGEPAA